MAWNSVLDDPLWSDTGGYTSTVSTNEGTVTVNSTSSDGILDAGSGFNSDVGLGSPTGNLVWWTNASNPLVDETITHTFTTDADEPAYAQSVRIAFSDLSNSAASGVEQFTVTINGEQINLLTDPRVTFQNNADNDYVLNADGSVSAVPGASTAAVSGGAINASEIGYITITDPAGISSVAVNYDHVSGSANGFNYDLAVEDATFLPPTVICFADTVMIETVEGPKAAGAIKVGDVVITRDDGPQTVRWVGSQLIAGARMAVDGRMRPIRIRAGALGDGTPTNDLLVSPQHRILVRSNIAQKIFGANEVLVAAKQLLLINGIDVADDLDSVTYVHILFDDHQIIFADGAEAESLYTGKEAIKGVGAAARAEIFEIFPQLAENDYEAQSARVLASGKMGRRLAHRHAQNDKVLVN